MITFSAFMVIIFVGYYLVHFSIRAYDMAVFHVNRSNRYYNKYVWPISLAYDYGWNRRKRLDRKAVRNRARSDRNFARHQKHLDRLKKTK